MIFYDINCKDFIKKQKNKFRWAFKNLNLLTKLQLKKLHFNVIF